MSFSQEQLREEILYKWVQFRGISTKKIALELRTSRRTVQRTLKRYNETGNTRRKSGSGRKQGFVNKKIEKNVLAALKRNPNLSVRDLAKKFGTTKSTVHRIKSKHSIKSFKKTKAPNRNCKQETVAKSRARKLYSRMTSKNYCFILDDETYCKMDFKSLPGHHYYSGKDRKSISDEFKVIKTQKFAKKVLVWQAISSCGKRSVPYFSTGSINGEIYLKECLQRRLLPFLRLHNKPVLFWPDLATCHYARNVTDWLKRRQIEFIEKNENPPNCPHLRPIERYWSRMKQKLLKHKKKMLNQFLILNESGKKHQNS